MSQFEQFCHLIVCRQKANKQRRKLLANLNKAYKDCPVDKYHYHKRDQYGKEERTIYRDQANMMKKIAKDIYSPFRREIKASVIYDANNNCTHVRYQKEHFSYKRIKEIADNYIFEKILLENKDAVDPYTTEMI